MYINILVMHWTPPGRKKYYLGLDLHPKKYFLKSNSIESRHFDSRCSFVGDVNTFGSEEHELRNWQKQQPIRIFIHNIWHSTLRSRIQQKKKNGKTWPPGAALQRVREACGLHVRHCGHPHRGGPERASADPRRHESDIDPDKLKRLLFVSECRRRKLRFIFGKGFKFGGKWYAALVTIHLIRLETATFYALSRSVRKSTALHNQHCEWKSQSSTAVWFFVRREKTPSAGHGMTCTIQGMALSSSVIFTVRGGLPFGHWLMNGRGRLRGEGMWKILSMRLDSKRLSFF